MKVVNEKFYGSEATGMDSIFEKKIINYVSEAAIKSMVQVYLIHSSKSIFSTSWAFMAASHFTCQFNT